ncbi:chromosome 10 orf 67, partial [Chelydra serpentina]
ALPDPLAETQQEPPRPAMSSLSAGRKLSLSPHILELLALPCCLEELEADCRPSISDDLKVGYFITDHATQTDIQEIVELKLLTTTTQALVQKEVKIRQSYQQQLCDALAVLRVDYEKKYRIHEDADSSLAESWQVLITKLQEKESKIQKLEAELQDYQENEDTQTIIFDSDDDIEKKMLEKENEDFKEEVSRLHDRILHLEESLKHSEKENNKLDKEVRGMQLKMEKDEKSVQKLIEAQEKIKMELEKERSLNQSMLKEQKDIETKVEKKSSDPQKKIPALQEKDKKKKMETVKSGSEITVPHETREPQKGYQKQQQKKSPSYKEAEKRALLAEIEKLKISEGQEKQYIQSLKNEVEQINRSWAKKFQILKKSLHAIKDEMFLRHALYRQAAAFNHASLNQTLAVPLYIETGARQINERRGGLCFPFSPLPQIHSQSTAEMEETDLNIVKIPTGSDMCCLYEDVSGDEEFVGGPPFPSPPSTLT